MPPAYGSSCFQFLYLIASFFVRFGGLTDVFGLTIDSDVIKRANEIFNSFK